ncbi:MULTISPECIES: hypothetical protein [Roseateles]|uniref:Uncharacterized protein n=1 Tax=Pelomonas caseinilytica TaxID=2906763 RepID=A0ABS8XFC1_9BURK|nr:MULTISPECIES: hypothetical protein [unclassified Roseateles]MCE4537209.1 hypothetical protein [Pelomonas sp. P7]HEV6964127.1 hypothetical protein [Roseateles sp.]
MKKVLDTLDRLEPPAWMLAAATLLLAAALLAAFVDTLQENLRHGEATRQAQRVGSLRQTISSAADARAEDKQPKLR